MRRSLTAISLRQHLTQSRSIPDHNTLVQRDGTTHSYHAPHPFDEFSQPKNGVSWTDTISVLSKYRDSSEKALQLASRMRSLGTECNCYTVVCLIRAATNLNWVLYGQQLHSYVIRSGFHDNVFVATSLVGMYMKCEFLGDAHQLFVEIPQPNLVSWNCLISGYVQNGHYLEALGFVIELVQTNFRTDLFTFSAALAACGKLSFLDLGRSIHCLISKFGFGSSVIAGNCLVDMYGKCGTVDDAIVAFHEMACKDTVTWNSVIGASARNHRVKDALDFLHQMPVPDTISYNEVINCIAQSGNMESALRMFSEMPNPNSSSWNSIIAGYIKGNRGQEALSLFTKMHSQNVTKDHFTFSSILRGIASLSALTWGTLIHCCTIKSGLDLCVVVGSALIDMYSKCGGIDNAEAIFRSLPKRNLVTWNAMISGHAHNGNSRDVVQLFEQLKKMHGLKPDNITFVSVLSACARDRGLLHVGIGYFESMIRDYGIYPMVEHCSCLIQLLGQGGDLSRAHRMIYELGFESCASAWRALLSACRTCGNLEVAETAAAKVLQLEGDHEFVYVLLSNIYASHGRWSDVSYVRELMKERGVGKEAGFSWIEVESVLPVS